MLKDWINTASTVLKYPYKFPRGFFILYLFVTVFQELAIKITSIITVRLKLLIPDSWLLLYQKLQFSFDELWSIWSGFLWLFLIILLLESISAILLGKRNTNDPIEPLATVSTTFLMLNTCILLLVLIYLKLTHQPLISFLFHPYLLQNMVIVPIFFLCYFSIRTYFVEFYSLFHRILHIQRYSIVIRRLVQILLLSLILFFISK